MENEVIDRLDRYDIALSISSGTLTATLDALWIDDISLLDAHEWGSEKIDTFVKRIAKSNGYKGDDIAGAIKKLEDEYSMDGDLLTKEFGSGSQHHLRDFSHHPTPVGLIFSLLMQFTGKGFGTKTNGEFVTYDVPGWHWKGVLESIYLGTVSWFFHMISDIAGSSGTRRMGREGTGLPGPLMSFMKEISAIPGIKNVAGKTNSRSSPNKEDNYSFFVVCSKMFSGTLLAEHDDKGKIISHKELKFDLRTELGIVNESLKNKQYIPVVLNELIVSSFYSVRRFMMQIEELGIESVERLKQIDITKCLPWKNDTIKHMRMIATATFTTIDLSSAGIKAAIKHKEDPSGFALEFMQGINYWGLGDFALSTNSEVFTGIHKMHTGFVAVVEKQKQELIAKMPDGQQSYDTGKYAIETAVSIAKIGTPIGFVSAAVGVYDEIKEALTELEISREELLRIQKECAHRIEIIQENESMIQQMVEEYFDHKMAVFTEAFDVMDRAINENDVEAFILGNNMIQKELAGKAMFETKEEFENLMMSDSAIVF